MKKWLACIAAVMILCSAALAESDVAALQRARDLLEGKGFSVSDEAFAFALEQHRMMREIFAQAGIAADESSSSMVYQLLLCEGIGEYDYDALTWMPTSDWIYVFDAEFFNIEGMYTEFLQGVQAIIPEAKITAVHEDLSGMNEYFEGSRKVYFDFNDHSYVVTLKSEGDWLNPEIIDFLNQVLKTEGFEPRLHAVSDAYDQMVFLICGSEKKAAVLRSLLGTEPWENNAGFDLMDWLGSLFE